MYIRQLELKDAAHIGNLHDQAFKNFFLTSLGKSFLIKFYASVLKEPDVLSIGIFSDEDVLYGFVIGNTKHANFYREVIIKNCLPLIFSSFIKLLNPLRCIRLVKALTSGQGNEFYNAIAELPCLLSICVIPNQNGLGLGGRLIKEFELCLKNKSLTKYFLTTDAENNDDVNSFYLKNNFLLGASYLQGKRLMNIYIKLVN